MKIMDARHQLDLFVLVGPCSNMAMQTADGFEDQLLHFWVLRVREINQMTERFIDQIKAVAFGGGHEPLHVNWHHLPGVGDR